jgi:hypothetical protein
MWMGLNVSGWSLVIGIVCIVFAIPLTVLGNLLTPRVRVWWAVRSLDTATKKLNGLVDLLKKLNDSPELTYSATVILRALQMITYCLFLLGYLTLLAVVFATGADLPPKPLHFHPGYIRLTVLIALLEVAAFTYTGASINALLRSSADGKEGLRRAIAEAQGKWASIANRTEK